MKRVTYCFLLGAAALGFSLLNQLSSHAQGGGAGTGAGAGPSGTAGQMGGGQTGTAGQMGSGQSGTAGQMGSGQTGTAGQMGTGQTGTASQVRPGGPGNIFPPGNQGLQGPAGMAQQAAGQFQLRGPNPWFGNPQVQQQLRFNANQNRQLNDAYNRAFSQYQRQIAGLDGSAEVNFRSNVQPGTTAGAARTGGGGVAGGIGGTAGTGTTAAGTSADRRGPGGTTAGTGTTTSGTAGTGTGAGTFGTGTATSGTANVGGTPSGGMRTGTNVGAATTASGMTTGTNVGAATTAGFNANLTPQQRQERLLEAERSFLSSFNRDVDAILTDPQQRARFGQLQNQFQAFDTFFDPTVRQRLNLTDAQLAQITNFRNDWFNQMQALQNATPAQRQAALARYIALRRQTVDRINQTLTEPQRRMLAELYGPMFDFGIDVYFPTTPPRVNDTTTPGVGGTFQGSTPNRNQGGADPGAQTRPGTSPTSVGSGTGIGTSTNPGATTGTSTGRTDR
jgi:hypothetical protein